ncbi:MAG: hypothetical protein IPJ16_00925 [Bacteroidales bacterium]|nr:hypothetical protein [Bacteroidales bacterium]
MSRIRKMKPIHLLLVFLFQINLSYSQDLDYKAIFESDWTKAVAFETENREWIEPLLKKHNISYPLAIAVIFPELVRYSALRDKMETTLLKTLYVNLGEYYANFSIGQLQMKPSFAESIRKQAPSVLSRRSGITFMDETEFSDIKNYRKSIVTDLEDPKIQFRYLIAFIKICEKRYKTNKMDDLTRIRFLATAYNYGIDKSIDEVNNMIYKKFYNTKLFKTENYSYSDVSVFWYRQYQ